MANDFGLFVGQLLRKPRQVVALAPSSKSLAREMAVGLGPWSGRVAELGSGTGKITRAILEEGVAAADLTCFELNADFAAVLAERFEGAEVRHAPAQEVGALTPGLGAVVSGLPLLSMPLAVQRAIVGGAFKVLRPGAPFIQFTYGPVPPVAPALREELGLRWTRSRKVWDNLPPARVYRFTQALV